MQDSASKNGKKMSDVSAAQARRLSIIDFSSEDDSLLGLDPGFVQDAASSEIQEQKSMELFVTVDDTKLEELFEPAEDNKLDHVGDCNEKTNEPVPQPSESLEPEMIRKNGKYNLRKSLAWDSAFFTSEGFLDAEELSSMISVEKGQKKMLPGIQEEVHQSTDSISTLGSDTLTLESVETNLFEDVRASIQRSSKAVSMAGESGKVRSGLIETKVGSGLKEADLASQRKLKPKVAPKKPTNISFQNPGKLAKPVSVCPQFSQSTTSTRDSTLSLVKRPKVLDKPVPSTTRMAKRVSLGGNLLKVEKDNTKTVAGRGAPVSNLPGSLRNVPRPSKSSSLASSTGTSGGPTSSIDSSGSTASLKFGKSLPNPIKRRTDPRTGNPNSSGSIPKTPSRNTSKNNKIESGKSSLSGHFMPSTKFASNISPASSISDWSSESVSSISSLQQVSCSSRDSISRMSSKSISMDFDTAQSVDCQSQTDDRSSIGSATRASGLRTSTGTTALPPSSKPSGLRLPSPKIGFFDGVKAVRTPKRCNPVVPSNLPKAAGTVSASPRGSSIKSKHGKVNSERAATIGAKPDTQRSSSNSKPKFSPLTEALKSAKTEVSSKSGSAKISAAKSPKVKTNTPLKFDLKVDEVGSGDDIGLHDKYTGVSQKKTVDALKAEDTRESKCSAGSENLNVVLVSEDCNGAGDTSSIPNIEYPTSSLEDSKHQEPVFETELCSIKNGDEKEKSCSEGQLDCLIRETKEMEIKGTEETVLGDTLTSQQNFSSEGNVCVPEPTSHQELLVCIKKEDSPNSLSNPVVSASPNTNGNASCKRIPFSAKDSVCNIDGLVMPEVEKNSELPFSEEHLNSEQLA